MCKSFDFHTPKHFQIAWFSNLLILSIGDEGYSMVGGSLRLPPPLKLVAMI
jgi:hypothetical protein